MVSPKDQPRQPCFWSRKTEEEEEKNSTKTTQELVSRTVTWSPAVHAQRRAEPFPSYFVTNESSKESWRTEEHGLFVFEREFQRCTGEQAKVVKLREGRLTRRESLGALLRLKF